MYCPTIYGRHDLMETLAAKKKRPPNIFNVFRVKIKAEGRSEKMNMMLLEMGDSVDFSGGDSSSQSSGSGFGSGFGEQKNKTDPFGLQRNNPFGGGSGGGDAMG